LWEPTWRASSCRWGILDRAATPTTFIGRKYQQNPQKLKSVAEQTAARKDILPLDADPVKAESAAIFQEKWMLAKTNEKYLQLLARHRQMYESS